MDIEYAFLTFLEVVATIALVICIFSLVYSFTGDSKYVTTDCYDGHGSKIDGVKCNKEIKCNTLIPFLDDSRCSGLIKNNKEVYND